MYATKTMPNSRMNGSINGSGSAGGSDPAPRIKSQRKSASSKDNTPPLPLNENMPIHLAERIRSCYRDKISASKPYDLIAAFQLDKGVVRSFYAYPRSEAEHVVAPFELTERRRRLLHRYYQRGRQYIVLYLHYMHENYLPVRLSSRSSMNHSHSGSSFLSSSGLGLKSSSRKILEEKRQHQNQENQQLTQSSASSSSCISGHHHDSFLRTSRDEARPSESTDSTEGSSGGKSGISSTENSSGEFRRRSNTAPENDLLCSRGRQQRSDSRSVWSWLRTERKTATSTSTNF